MKAYGAPRETWTPDPTVKSRLLYHTELWAQLLEIFNLLVHFRLYFCLIAKSPLIIFLVGWEGVEPSIHCWHGILSPICIPVPSSAHLVTPGGFEPTLIGVKVRRVHQFTKAPYCWSLRMDLNHWPLPYQRSILTSWNTQGCFGAREGIWTLKIMVLSHTCLPVASLSRGTPPEIRTQKLTGLNRYCIPVPTMGYNFYRIKRRTSYCNPFSLGDFYCLFASRIWTINYGAIFNFNGAGHRTWTHNLLITSQLLYQLR